MSGVGDSSVLATTTKPNGNARASSDIDSIQAAPKQNPREKIALKDRAYIPPNDTPLLQSLNESPHEKSLEDIIEPYNDHQGLRDIHKALYRAVDSRNVEVARILLGNGGEINHSYEKSRSAWTNLHYATSRGDMAMAEILLLAGIEVAG